MMCLTYQLQQTPTARWLAQWTGQNKNDKRALYIRTAIDYMTALNGAPLDRSDLIEAVGKKSASTMYNLFGRKSPNALWSHLDESVLAIVRGGSVVDDLIREATAFSYQPYWEGWLDALREDGDEDRQFAAETQIRCVAAWAHRNQAMATYGMAMPPLSAIEALMVIADRPNAAQAAADVLKETIAMSTGPTAGRPEAVVRGVQQTLATLGETTAVADLVRADLQRLVAQLEYHLPRLPAQRQQELIESLRPQLVQALRIIGEGDHDR